MDNIVKEYVIELLKDYRKMQQKIALLRFELAHPAQVSATEMIHAMAFSRDGGEGHPAGHISDKTLYIAMNYQNEAVVMNRHSNDAIVNELMRIENKISRLENCISQLPSQQQLVIYGVHRDGLSWHELAEVSRFTERTLHRHHAQAIAALSFMYEILQTADVILD